MAVAMVQRTVPAPSRQEQASPLQDQQELDREDVLATRDGPNADDLWARLSQVEQDARRAECERETQALLDAAVQAAAEARAAELALLEEQERARRGQEERDRIAREEEERRLREAREQAAREQLEREIAAAEKLRLERAAELLRLQEAARLAAEKERLRQEALVQEQRAQQRLRQIGRCPASYAWKKIPGGYRCAAGGHFVSDAQVNYL
jgi:hypothetical protein